MIRRLAVPVLVAALAALPLFAGPYFLTLMNYIGMSALAALGLVLLTGVGGLTSFGQAAFVGLGAYSTAWFTTSLGGMPWLGLLVALTVCGTVALVLGLATLRLSGHLLPLSTIAWGLAIFYVFGNTSRLGGHDGISAIPPVTIGTLPLNDDVAGYMLIWLSLGAAMWLCTNILAARQGRAIRALRGGAAMAESLGIDPFRIRLTVFILSSLFAAVSGWQYAHVQRYIGPTAFDVGAGMDYLFMAMLGGAGEIGGALVGAIVVTLTRDALQDILPSLVSQGGRYEVIVFAIAFIFVLQRARGGLIPAMRRLLPVSTPSIPEDAALHRRPLPQSGTNLLQVNGLVKRFGGLVAVNDVSFTLHAGDILGLIGPNGAGKSTLFDLISGAARIDSGRITFAGQDITRLPAKRIATTGLARTFQHVRLRPAMSLLENVMLGAHGRGQAGVFAGALRLDRAEERGIQGEAIHQLRRVGLAATPHALAGSLPLGQQRVLEIARALASDPALVLLDEPAAGLRHSEKLALASLLRELRAEGITILLVEHDMEFVMNLVDRAIVMQFGALIADGPPALLRADPRVQAAYLGSPT